MPTITVECHCCKGRGRIDLTGEYLRTYILLCRQREWVNGANLAKQAGCRNEAMCNRLRALEKHRLAGSRRDGRQVFWIAVAPAEAEADAPKHMVSCYQCGGTGLNPRTGHRCQMCHGRGRHKTP